MDCRTALFPNLLAVARHAERRPPLTSLQGDANAIAAAFLGVVKCGIGASHQVGDAFTRRQLGYAEARGEPLSLGSSCTGNPAKALRAPSAKSRAATMFVPGRIMANSSPPIRPATKCGAIAERMNCANVHDDRIAGRMAEIVVDRLKVIEVGRSPVTMAHPAVRRRGGRGRRGPRSRGGCANPTACRFPSSDVASVSTSRTRITMKSSAIARANTVAIDCENSA